MHAVETGCNNTGYERQFALNDTFFTVRSDFVIAGFNRNSWNYSSFVYFILPYIIVYQTQ